MPKYDLPRGVIMTPPLRRKYGVLPLRLARVNHNNSCKRKSGHLETTYRIKIGLGF